MESNNRSAEERERIGKTIIEQMGGLNRLTLMTGVEFYEVTKNGVMFSFKGCGSLNKLVVNLTEDDLYEMKFYKTMPQTQKNMEMKLEEYLEAMDMSEIPIEEYEGVYHDMLVNIFESTTGLYLTI